MAQFDVHSNLGKQRDTIPYVVIVQSALFDDYRRRLVVPLVRQSDMKSTSGLRGSRINPVFTVERVKLVLHPLEMVSVGLDQLGAHVGSLKDHGAAIADALDEVFTRSWG